MIKATKITDEELNQVNELRKEYQIVALELGELNLIERNLKSELEKVQEDADDFYSSYLKLQEKVAKKDNEKELYRFSMCKNNGSKGKNIQYDIGDNDFYWLNFDIDNFGRLRSNTNFTDVLSNESAIVKQGVAINMAIQIVLQKTGRDKVILMGHSMGGLASREYLQTSLNWQQDGQHHVAKLVTTGTPHGGYTGTNAGLVTGIESRSEAYRDLRKDYTYSGYNGVYLYGGTENSSVIANSIFSVFYNVDINCNGINGDNTTIVGLNQKNLPLTLDYAYIIGDCTNCDLLQGSIEGDGIVRSVNANLSNIYTNLPSPRNEFIHEADAIDFYIGLHSDLPKAIPVSFKGLNEPNEYNISYGINLNQTYKGFITEQPVVGGYSSDYDDYKMIDTQNITKIVNY
jgi:hypothetical protein